MRWSSRLLAPLIALAVLTSTGRADAVEKIFGLNAARSHVALCDPTGTVTETPRLFLNGVVSVDFDDVTPIPGTGSASAFTIPSMLLFGTQDVSGGAPFVQVSDMAIRSLIAPSSGAVTGLAGPDEFRIDLFNIALAATVRIVPGTPFPIDQDFAETVGSPQPDFVGELTAPGGGDCDLNGVCFLSNDPGGALPSLAALASQCQTDLPTPFCDTNDFCLTIMVQDFPGLGDFDLKVKIVLSAARFSMGAAVTALQQAANPTADTSLDFLPCPTPDGVVDYTDATGILDAAFGKGELPCLGGG